MILRCDAPGVIGEAAQRLLCFVAAAGSKKQMSQRACHCSKGFRSIVGHGHFHCQCCHQPFRYRALLFSHETNVHGKTVSDIADKNKSSKKKQLCHRTPSGTAGKLSDKVPATAVGKMKMKQSCSSVGTSNSSKYATSVKICADGTELVSRLPCYSGNLVFPTVVPRSKKVRCPICKTRFRRIETFRNHIICVHSVIHPGDTVYSCVPCKFETSHYYLFSGHMTSRSHLSNLSSCDSREPKVQLPADYSAQQQEVGRFFLSGSSFSANVVNAETQLPRVVWYGQPNHVCSSHCLNGLGVRPPSASTVPTRRPCMPPALQVASVPTETGCVDVGKESKMASAADASQKKKVTARKSTTSQPLTVAFDFVGSKKKMSGPQKVLDVAEAGKTSVPRPDANMGVFPKEEVTVIDSDSDSADVAPGSNCPQRVTRSSSANTKRVSPSLAKPSTSSAVDKRKDSQLAKSTNKSCTGKSQPQKSASATGRTTEALLVTCSGSNSAPSIVSMSQQKSKLNTTTAVKTPLSVTTVQQVPEVHSSLLTSSSASVDSTASAVNVSTAVRSVPVIGVAKALPAVTTTLTQTPAQSNRSLYSLHRFSEDTLWSELCRRGGMRSCDCGVSFMDRTLFLLHRSCHSDVAPLKCAFCGHKAATNYDFHAHLLDHKK